MAPAFFLPIVAGGLGGIGLGAPLVIAGPLAGTIFASGALAGGLAIGLSAATVVGLGFAGNLLISALAPKAQTPKPTDRQFLTKNPIAPRDYALGEVRMAGVQALGIAKEGSFYRITLHMTGEVDSFVDHYIDDKLATVDGSGFVTDDEFSEEGEPRMRIINRYGTDDQAAFQELIDKFPDGWSAAHQAKGIACTLSIFDQTGPANFGRIFPRAENTTYSAHVRAGKVFQPGVAGHSITDKATWEYSDNAVDQILHLCRHDSVLRMPAEWFTSEVLADWEAQRAIAAEQVPLKAGGTEKRYRSAGVWSGNERPVDVMSRWLSACDGVLMPHGSGGVVLRVGKYEEPTVTIDDDVITGYRLDRTGDLDEIGNVVRARFLSPDHKLSEQDADEWRFGDSVQMSGSDESLAIDLITVPSHAQARRLMKRVAKAAAADYRGVVFTNIRGLRARGERFIKVSIGTLGLEFEAQVISWKPILKQGSVIVGVEIGFIQVDPLIDAWDPATEEGTGPANVPDLTGPFVPPDVANFAVVTGFASARVTWDEPTLNFLVTEIDVSIKDQDDWETFEAGVGDTSVDISGLQVGVVYDFRARHLDSLTQKSGNYTDPPLERLVNNDPAAPAVVSIESSSSPAAGEVQITFTSPSSANYASANIYRHTSNDFVSATLLTPPISGVPSQQYVFGETGLVADDYYYWITAVNGTGVESAEVATGAITVS